MPMPQATNFEIKYYEEKKLIKIGVQLKIGRDPAWRKQ